MTRFWNESGRGSHRDHLPPRSIRPAVTRGLRWAAAVLPVLASLTFGAPRAVALDPRRSLTQYQKQSWGPEQGLPCNNVLTVIQANDGYLWLGTEEGLVRFDGLRTRIFDHHTDAALVNNSVYSVTEDSRQSGDLLLGTAGGVCRYAGGTVSVFKSNAELTTFSGAILFQDPVDGALWVRTPRGLLHVEPDGAMTDKAATMPGGPSRKIHTVCRDESGRLWVGTTEGLYRQHGDQAAVAASPGFDPVPGWSGKEVNYLSPARGGGLWVGSRDGGSGRLDPDGVFHPRPALKGCTVSKMLEDRAGMLWVGTNGSGLFRLPVREDAGAGPPAAALTTENGLIHNLVNGLCEDREGNLWIATQLGLQVLRDVSFVNFGRPEGLAGDDVRSVFEDSRGQIWIGNENGLGKLDPSGDRVTSYPMPPSPLRPGNNRVLCVGESDDGGAGVWAGTTAGVVSWREGKLELLPLRDDLDRSAVRTLCQDAAGNRWIGTNTGLYQVRDRRVQARFTVNEGLAHDSVRALHLDGLGNLWIATGSGLSRRGPDGRITNFLNSGPNRGDGTVLSFYEEPGRPHDLFVGTEFGLHRVHTAADGTVEIRAYTEREGLFDNIVWGLVADHRGNLWMSCNKGVSRVAQADLERFDRGTITRIPHVAYGVADGMRSRECNGGHQPAAWRDRGGRLWFATVKGAAVVDPANLDSNLLPPPVLVEEMTADGRTLPGGTKQSPAPIPELLPGTQKLGFRYTALSLVAPETNRFRYRLEGFDADWTDAKTERTVRYTNLPPGHYRFTVQAATAHGPWSSHSAAFPFRLQPFFYQTGWFRTLVLGALVVLLWGSRHGIRRRLQSRLARAEAELRERTRTQEILREAKEAAEHGRQVARQAYAEAETAREEAEQANRAKSEFLSRLSHELRTPLNAILGFGQLLELEALPLRQGESVAQILGGGRHLLGLVDEILDLARVESGMALVHSEEIALAPLLHEVASLIEPLAQEHGVSLRVGAAPPAAAHLLADRQRLKQVFLNLLINAVKYNRAVRGEVFVGITEVVGTGGPDSPGGRVRITIRDTGLGIDAEGLGKLFTPFERLGAAYGPIKGTGLGLVVSKQLVQAMHGTIGAESVLGVGSTFWVELPSVLPASPAGGGPETPPEPVSLTADNGQLTGEQIPGPPPVSFGDGEVTAGADAGQKVLYIEDNASNRHLVEVILAQYRPDLRLRCAPDGTSGLVAARTFPVPQLILLDLQLPDLNGDEVLGRLREDHATLHIPVVVLSADATSRSRDRLMAAGAADYLTKPLELPRLLEMLAGHFPDGKVRNADTRAAGRNGGGGVTESF